MTHYKKDLKKGMFVKINFNSPNLKHMIIDKILYYDDHNKLTNGLNIQREELNRFYDRLINIIKDKYFEVAYSYNRRCSVLLPMTHYYRSINHYIINNYTINRVYNILQHPEQHIGETSICSTELAEINETDIIDIKTLDELITPQ